MDLDKASGNDLILERIKYFQNVQVWPLSGKIDYEGWLSNFHGELEIKVAYALLEFFVYYPDSMINQMFQVSIERALKLMQQLKLKENDHAEWDSVYFSYIPGENPNPTDSGRMFLRKLRDLIGVNEDRIIEYNEIYDRRLEAGMPIGVILVDDFVGSGAQCDTAWNRKNIGGTKFSMSDLSESGEVIFVYASILMNYMGEQRISRNCEGLGYTYAHLLGKEYDIFDVNCFCWKGNVDFYHAGLGVIREVSERVGIEDSLGFSVRDLRGFNNQGLGISFDHGTPDAVLPIFYWKEKGWKPLVSKHYDL